MLTAQAKDALPLEAFDPSQWLAAVQFRAGTELERSLDGIDDARLDRRWAEALRVVRNYTLRPGKRLRPALVLIGHGIGRGSSSVPPKLWQFAAGLELLHTFLLIHDDVADRAELRRGDAALHKLLAHGKLGEDLAVVSGDHLFARGLELMLASGLPRGAEVVTWYLSVLRQTAVGQYLDLRLASAPLKEISLFEALRVADLKTARYGFAAPLVCGAVLGGASAEVVDALERVGRHAGLAFQLNDDLLGLLGDDGVTGKSGVADLEEGKRTFPVLAAYARAQRDAREELERLWTPGPKSEDEVKRARTLLWEHGGVAATRRAIDRHTRCAQRALSALPDSLLTHLLNALVAKLARRTA